MIPEDKPGLSFNPQKLLNIEYCDLIFTNKVNSKQCSRECQWRPLSGAGHQVDLGEHRVAVWRDENLEPNSFLRHTRAGTSSRESEAIFRPRMCVCSCVCMPHWRLSGGDLSLVVLVGERVRGNLHRRRQRKEGLKTGWWETKEQKSLLRRVYHEQSMHMYVCVCAQVHIIMQLSVIVILFLLSDTP